MLQTDGCTHILAKKLSMELMTMGSFSYTIQPGKIPQPKMAQRDMDVPVFYNASTVNMEDISLEQP